MTCRMPHNRKKQTSRSVFQSVAIGGINQGFGFRFPDLGSQFQKVAGIPRRWRKMDHSIDQAATAKNAFDRCCLLRRRNVGDENSPRIRETASNLVETRQATTVSPMLPIRKIMMVPTDINLAVRRHSS